MLKNMTFKRPFLFACIVFLYSCSDNLDDQTTRGSQLQLGLNIENGPRQGFQYIDSNNTEYNYRYYTMTITNDTTIPVKLEIGFQNTELRLSDSSKSNIFLLPRHLTPKKQQMDLGGISKELKAFLDFNIDSLIHLTKTINPAERCVMTFGVLTDIKYTDPTTPFATKLLTENERPSGQTFKLKINDALIIPCGQFTYIDK